MTTASAPGPVKTRLVYYIAGFDTRSARSYHQLYSTEAELQQPVNRCEYKVSEAEPSGPRGTSWTIRARDGEHEIETRYTFLQWNDIVHEHWPRSTTRVALSVPAFYLRFAANGGIARTWQLSRAFFWMLMLPLFYTLATLLAASLAAYGAANLASRWVPASWPEPWTWIAAGLAAAALVVKGGLLVSEQQRVFWLMRAWTFLLIWGRENPEPWQQRWEEFARKIEDELQANPADEVLIVGHSAGAMAAIAVAERWLALGGQRPDKVKLVTLGNATPMLSIIPEAGWFREQIATVGASNMPWIDYTAPTDALCYALVDSFTSCGLPSPNRRSYRVKSARFDKMFKPENFAKIRHDYFRVHFQYLMATCNEVDNDFFRLTAGPKHLVVEAPAP